MDKKSLVYEYKTKSLRENLVTLPEFISQVKKMETGDIDILGIGISNQYIDIDKATDIYLAPYVWDKPCYISTMMARGTFNSPDEITSEDVKSMSHEEVVEWVSRVSDRISPYLQNAIPEADVNFIDNHPSYGIILHNLTGELNVFNYDLMESVECTSFDVLGISFLIRLYLNQHIINDEDGTVDNIRANKEPYNTMRDIMNVFEYRTRSNIVDPYAMITKFDYMKITDDKTRPDMSDYRQNIAIPITPTVHIMGSQRDSLLKYLDTMTRHRAKVLTIP